MTVPHRTRMALAVLLTLLPTACGGKAEAPPGAPEARRAPVEVVTARPEPFTEVYRIAAPALPEEVLHLSAEVAGTLAALNADVGDRVAEGRVLARLDPEPLMLARDTRRAELERARVRLSLAEKTLARQQALYREGTVADPVLEEAELAARLAAADLRLAELALKDAERDLANTEVRAPAAGEITLRAPEVGAVLAKGAALFHLARTERVRLVPGLSERQVVHVHEGDRAEVRFDALPGRSFAGAVTRVGSVDRAGEAAFPVEVRVDNPDRAIRPGMVARVGLTGRTVEGAIVIPAVALRHGEWGVAVYVAGDGVARRVRVGVTALEDETAVIGSGLEEGMEVVVVGQTTLKGGEPVVVTVRDGRPTEGERERPAVYGLP